MNNTPPAANPEALTLKQACAALQISQNTAYILLREKRLHGTRIGRQWRFSPQAIAETLTGGTK
jgi:excisionase family DNA binding protein